jgi:hypothetical protein
MQGVLERAFSRSSDAVRGVFVDGARPALWTAYLHVCGHRPFSPTLRRQQIVVGQEALRVCHAHRELMIRGELPCGFAQVGCSGVARSQIEHDGEISGGIIDWLWEALMCFWAEFGQKCLLKFNSRFDSGTGTFDG